MGSIVLWGVILILLLLLGVFFYAGRRHQHPPVSSVKHFVPHTNSTRGASSQRSVHTPNRANTDDGFGTGLIIGAMLSDGHRDHEHSDHSSHAHSYDSGSSFSDSGGSSDGGGSGDGGGGGGD